MLAVARTAGIFRIQVRPKYWLFNLCFYVLFTVNCLIFLPDTEDVTSLSFIVAGGCFYVKEVEIYVVFKKHLR